MSEPLERIVTIHLLDERALKMDYASTDLSFSTKPEWQVWDYSVYDVI